MKEVRFKGRRYIICPQPKEEKRERITREAIVRKLKEKLQNGGIKSFIANRGYRSFLSVKGESVSIDWKKVNEDSRYDGKFVLRTNTQSLRL